MTMEHLTLTPQLRIADLLTAEPRLVALFIELHADCVGCSMNKFCTLAEMCAQYELDLPTVLARIETF